MKKNIKKIATQKKHTNSTTIPMIALLAALGVSSLTYTVTVQADTGTAAKTYGMHMHKGKRGGEGKHTSSADKADKVRPAAAGVIQSVQGSVVTVKSRDGQLYTVETSSATIFRGGRGQASTTIAVSDLKVGDMLGVKGALNGTHVVATSVMTSPQHPFMKKIYEKINSST